MPYAHNGQISQDPIEGGIEITEAQYQEALQGMLKGLDVTIDGGFKVAPKSEPETPEQPGPEPQPIKVFSSLEFLERFTEAEQLVVVAATMVSAEIKLWYDKLLAAEYVSLDDPRTEAGIDALIAAELIAPSRKTELLAPQTPE